MKLNKRQKHVNRMIELAAKAAKKQWQFNPTQFLRYMMFMDEYDGVVELKETMHRGYAIYNKKNKSILLERTGPQRRRYWPKSIMKEMCKSDAEIAAED